MVGKAVQLTQKEYTENASKVLYLYDEVDELTGFAEKSDDTDLEYKYEYNESGDRTSLEIKGKIKKEDVSEIIKYEYEEGLLIKETSSRKGDIQYEYDGNGNLVKKTGADNDVSYEYTVENRLKAVKSGGELLMAAGYRLCFMILRVPLPPGHGGIYACPPPSAYTLPCRIPPWGSLCSGRLFAFRGLCS